MAWAVAGVAASWLFREAIDFTAEVMRPQPPTDILGTMLSAGRVYQAYTRLPWPKAAPALPLPIEPRLSAWRASMQNITNFTNAIERKLAAEGRIQRAVREVLTAEELTHWERTGLTAELWVRPSWRALNAETSRLLIQITGTECLAAAFELLFYFHALFYTGPPSFVQVLTALTRNIPPRWQEEIAFTWDTLLVVERNLRALNAWLRELSPEMEARATTLGAILAAQKDLTEVARIGLDEVQLNVYVAQHLWNHSTRTQGVPEDESITEGPLYLPEFLVAVKNYSPTIFYADPESRYAVFMRDSIRALRDRETEVPDHWLTWSTSPQTNLPEIAQVLLGIIQGVDASIQANRYLPRFTLVQGIAGICRAAWGRYGNQFAQVHGWMMVRVQLVYMACTLDGENVGTQAERLAHQRGRREAYLFEAARFEDVWTGSSAGSNSLLEILADEGPNSLLAALQSLADSWANPAAVAEAIVSTRAQAMLRVTYFFMRTGIIPPSFYAALAVPPVAFGVAEETPVPMVMAAVEVLRQLAQELPATRKLLQQETELRFALLSEDWKELLPAAMAKARAAADTHGHPATAATLEPLLLQAAYLLPYTSGGAEG